LANEYSNTNLRREIVEGDPLNDRELEILELSAQGLSSAQIAEKIFLADETVKSYRKTAMYKIGGRNIVHAVALALSLGYINPDKIASLLD